MQIDNGFVTANGCHGAQICVSKSNRWLAVNQINDVLSQLLTLLQCNLRHTGEAYGIFLCNYCRYIANGKNVGKTFNSVYSVGY